MIFLRVCIYYVDDCVLRSEHESEEAEYQDEDVLPDDVLAGSEANVPEGDDLDEGRGNEAEQGEAEGSDNAHERSDGGDCDGQHDAHRHHDGPHHVVGEDRPLGEVVLDAVPHDLDAYEELQSECAVDCEGDRDLDDLGGAGRKGQIFSLVLLLLFGFFACNFSG